MNRAQLLAALRQLGYKGEPDLKKIKQWLTDNGYNVESIDVGEKSVKIDDAFAKTVTISVSADAGEEVMVKDESPSGEQPAEGETPPPPPQDGQNSVVISRARLKALEETARLAKASGKVIHAPAIRSDRERAHKAYNAKAAREGRSSEAGSYGTAFSDAERAEQFGAWSRLTMAKGLDYPQKAADIEITKALGTIVNSLGGALIPEDFRADLIELKEKSGVMRSLIGVTPVPHGTMMVPRLVSDVTPTWDVEGSAGSDQDKPTFDNVGLSTKKMRAIVRINRELMNEAAMAVGDIVARSMARAFGTSEDAAAINGDATSTYGGIRGLVNKLDSNAYHTSTATTWAAITSFADIASTFAKLDDIPGLGEPVGLCSKQFFDSVLWPMAHAAGGTTMEERINGRPAYRIGGYPFVTCPSAPKTLPASKIAFWVGYWGAGAKFGETGSMEIDTSDQRYWEYDQIGMKAVQKIDINIHEAGASGDPIVLAGMKTT